MYTIVTTDDLRPETVPLFEEYFDKLKKEHKELQVTAYVPAFYQEFSKKEENNIEDNKDFYRFWKKRKDWLKVVPHCYSHKKPPECLRNRGEQIDCIQKTLRALEPYLDGDGCIGWKASFYRMNKTTLQLLRSLDIRWVSQWWTLQILDVIKRPLPQHIVLGTHCGTKEQNNPDNIDRIYDKLDFHLCDLESKGLKYSSFNQLVRYVLE